MYNNIRKSADGIGPKAVQMGAKVIKFLWAYEFSRWVIFWAWFLTLLLLVAVVAYVSPKAALVMVKTVEPIAGLVKDLFWALMPDDLQPIHEVGRFLGSIFRKAVETTSHRTQLVIQMAVLDGFLFVTIGAHIGRWVTMIFVRRVMIRKFIESHQEFGH